MNYKEIKNYGKTIKNYFQFLNKHAFSMKQYNNGIDYEVIYSKPDCKIEVICALGTDANILTNYENKLIDDKQLMENSHFDVYIAIDRGICRCNLLQCNLFNPLSITDLKEKILNCKNDIQKILKTYSSFLEKNLDNLL